MGWIEPIVIQSAVPSGMIALGSADVFGLELVATFAAAALAVLLAVRRRHVVRTQRLPAGSARTAAAAPRVISLARRSLFGCAQDTRWVVPERQTRPAPR